MGWNRLCQLFCTALIPTCLQILHSSERFTKSPELKQPVQNRRRMRRLVAAARGLVTGSVTIRVLGLVGALAAVLTAIAVVFIVVAPARVGAIALAPCCILTPNVLKANLVCPIAEPGSAIAAAVDGGIIIGIAITLGAALIVIARAESGAIAVAVGVLIDPDRTHPIPVAAAGLARVGNTEVLGIVFSPFMPALLHAIAIPILISVLPHLNAIAASIVIVVIPLRACQSAQRERDNHKSVESLICRVMIPPISC